ncbi:hypothetical protein HDU76_005945 [Blyttiomyces sp. JEL0837]|nr:hypothetical protein HDU76_005945 [Blyttiomyces sp. JEL0837]
MKAESELDKQPWIHYLSLFIEFLQYLAFCFEETEWGPYGNEFGTVVQYSQIERILVAKTNVIVDVVLIGLSILLILIMLIDAGYVIFSFFSKEFKAGVWPLRLLRSTVGVLSSVLYLPVVTSLLSVYHCPEHEDLYHCYDNFHVGLIVASTVGLLTFVPFALLMANAYFEPDPHSESIMARPLPISDMVEISLKTLTVIYADVIDCIKQ